jgi:hypothetical protein
MVKTRNTSSALIGKSHGTRTFGRPRRTLKDDDDDDDDDTGM